MPSKRDRTGEYLDLDRDGGEPERCRAVRERCAKIAESWADRYPEDVFPPLGIPPAPGIDRIAAQANRHSAMQIARLIRQGADEDGGGGGAEGVRGSSRSDSRGATE